MVKLLLPTNCLSVFDHFVGLAFKACVRYFYQIFIFSPNDSPSKTMKNVFLFRIKSSFCSQDIQFFSRSFSHFPDPKGQMELKKFMMS